MTFEKEKKVLSKIIYTLGFVYYKDEKYAEVWKHHEKNLIIKLPSYSTDKRWIKNKKSEISKLVSHSFSIEEVKQQLRPFIKKRKIEFTQNGRVKLLRVSKESLMKEQQIERKEQEDWRKILNDLPVDLDLESELLILLLNREEPKTDFVSKEHTKELSGYDKTYNVDVVEFKKTRVKNISDKREYYQDEDTKRENKEKLKILEKKKKVLEEQILKEIRIFGGDEK